MKRSGICLAIAIIFLVCACTTSLTGNSSETSNGITVIAGNKTVEGKTPAYSSIYLIDNQYNPTIGSGFDSVVTDSTGQFRFIVQNRNYNLFFNGTNGLKSVISISISSGVNKDTMYDSLSPTGSFQGYSPYSRSEGYRSLLYLEGSPYYTDADSSGLFKMTDIPTGYYRIIKWAHKYTKNSDVSNFDPLSEINSSYISVKSDTTLTIDW